MDRTRTRLRKLILLSVMLPLMDIMAAIGRVQLQRYPELLEKRYALVRQYQALLAGHGVEPAPHFRNGEASSCHLYLTRLTGRSEAERNHVIETMAQEGVASNVHYKPLPMLTAYQALGFSIKDYPNALAQYENELTLPLYSTLCLEDVEYIANRLLHALSGGGGHLSSQ